MPPPLALSNIFVNATQFGSTATAALTTATFQAALDYCFGSVASPHGTAGAMDNKICLFPPGLYVINAPLQLKHLHGGRIMGSGRGSTQITNSTANGSVFVTNGCGYAHFEGLGLVANGTGRALDLDWDNSAGGPGLQNNTFLDMNFGLGAYGVDIGRTGYGGQGNLFLNCFWIVHTVAGLRTATATAVNQSVIGGNFQGCSTGILVTAGSVPTIHGVGFQTSTLFDISIAASVADAYSILACRSESAKFVSCTASPVAINIAGCAQTGATGLFLETSGKAASVQSSQSVAGQIVADDDALVRVETVKFTRADAISVVGATAMIEVHSSHIDGLPILARRYTLAGELDYNVTGNHIHTTVLAFGTSSPLALFTTRADDIIAAVEVIIDTAFNGSPTLSVGISGTVAKYMATASVTLTAAASSIFKVTPGLPAAGAEALIATYVAGGASVGAARIKVHYAREL